MVQRGKNAIQDKTHLKAEGKTTGFVHRFSLTLAMNSVFAWSDFFIYNKHKYVIEFNINKNLYTMYHDINPLIAR